MGDTIEVPVFFFTTTEGHTRRIAERMVDVLRAHGLESAAIDVRSPEVPSLLLERAGGVVLGASVRGGRHQRPAIEFAHRHRERLQALPSAFFSVDGRDRGGEGDEAAAFGFTRRTGWTPRRLACLRGRRAYTRYGRPKRRVVRRTTRGDGASAETSSDHEFTDWKAVDRLAAEVALDVREWHLRGGRRVPDLAGAAAAGRGRTGRSGPLPGRGVGSGARVTPGVTASS